MSNALLQSGSVPKGNSSWAPIYTGEFFSGFWTNRNPLRDPATTFLFSKFYSATRYEAIWAGLNTEISARLTLCRAPGHSVYNTGIFPNINDYYSYHIVGVNFPEYIRVVCDTDKAVYDCTGPNTQKIIYTKQGTAGQCRFIAIGNTLYLGDGVSLFQYLSPSYVWQPNYAMPSGAFVVDKNGNIQSCLGYGVSCSNVSIANSVVTLTVAPVTTTIPEGTTIVLRGMLTGYLNGLNLTTTSSSPVGSTTIVASYAAPNLNEPETGIRGSSTGYVYAPTLNNNLGPVQPIWNQTWGGITVDHNTLWEQTGPQLRVWGVPAPVNAPNVTNVINTQVVSEWLASTYYLANQPTVYITANSGPNTGTNYLYGLSIIPPTPPPNTTGTFASEAYTGTTGEVVTDGATGVSWTCQGPAQRRLGAPYSLGAIILVTFTVSYTITVPNPNYHGGQPQPNGPQPTMQQTLSNTYTQFYQCTTPGVTSGNPDSDQSYFGWQSGVGTVVTDGFSGNAVVWTNIGPAVQRATGTSSAPSMTSSGPYTNTQTAGVIGDTTDVSASTSIVTSQSTTATAPIGTVELVNSPGISGAGPNEPAWAIGEGSFTPDGSMSWKNNGNSPATGGTTGASFPWMYSYAYVDDVTGAVGPSSPLSNPILLGTDSYIQVQGDMSSLPSVGSIIIYRTTQGGAQPFYIAEIDNDITKKTWTYYDFSPDQGYIGSTMNNLLLADLTGYNSSPPAGFLPVCLHLSAIWGFVNNILWFSAGGGVVNDLGGWEAFPPINNIVFQSKGITAWDTNSGLYAILTDSLQLIAGTSSPFNISQVAPIGIQSPNCFSLNGQSPFLYTSDQQVIGIDPSTGITVDGWPIANLLASDPFTPSTTHISWYVRGTDQRLFVSDGATGYYNMINSISPEAPTAVWSPKREIVGGCSAVKAVETSPGNYNLLVGPPIGGGPILYRDITVATDNLKPYSAWAVFGSNVLCHPGTVAEIGFVHVEAPRYGLAPQVSVLLDEIMGYPHCPEFSLLPYTETDPVRLSEPSSIYSNRHYLSQSEEPSWCRHLQIMVSFGESNVLDELLTFTVYGSLHVERTEAGR